MNKKIKILIIGSKNFDDYNYFEEKLYKVLEKYFEEDYKITIREQEVNTVDTFAIRFAKENNCNLERYKIKWDEFGKSAAYKNIKRLIFGENAQSASDLLVCFYKKIDKKVDRDMTERVIEEFKSVINLENQSQNYFIFTKSK